MKLLIVNGPNLNMLGVREPMIYGNKSYGTLCSLIYHYAQENDFDVEIFQSNHEGEIVDKIQEAYYQHVDGIVINPAAFTHTSVAILDALKATNIPAVEVHISKVNEREEFRKISYVRSYCIAAVIGKGLEGYLEAMKILKDKIYASEN